MIRSSLSVDCCLVNNPFGSENRGMTSIKTTRAPQSRPLKVAIGSLLLALGLSAGSVLAGSGCATTEFINEGPGQPSDEASGAVPPGSIGACKVPFSKRPPLIDKALWADLRVCGPKTPMRFIRVGYGKFLGRPDPKAERRIQVIMKALKEGEAEKDGNARMLSLLRSVHREAMKEPKLQIRLERASGRTVPCDYTYLLNTTEKAHEKYTKGQLCAAYAYDPKLRREHCMFDTRIKEAVWLTSAWGCVAFTGTMGEGQSCYRLCAYDDYCAAQVSCAAPDLDLVLCALGVCLPAKIAGLW